MSENQDYRLIPASELEDGDWIEIEVEGLVEVRDVTPPLNGVVGVVVGIESEGEEIDGVQVTYDAFLLFMADQEIRMMGPRA